MEIKTPRRSFDDQHRSIGHSAGNRITLFAMKIFVQFLLFEFISCPRHLSKPHHPSQIHFSKQTLLCGKASSVMSGRRKSSLHSQEPSKQGPSSTQDEPNGSEAKARHPATFDEKDQNYDDLLDSQLKALCWDRGFTGGGTRAGLIQRLRTHDARERESSNFTPPHVSRPGLASEDLSLTYARTDTRSHGSSRLAWSKSIYGEGPGGSSRGSGAGDPVAVVIPGGVSLILGVEHVS